MKTIEKQTPVSRSRRGDLLPPENSLVRVPASAGPRRPSIFRRLFVTGVIGSGLAYAGLQLSQVPDAVPEYKTEKVRRGTLMREIIASGPLVPAFKSEIHSVVAGTALAVHADFGSEVEAGQPLVQIDPATAKLTLKEAQINLGSARATIEVAKTRAEQCRILSKDGLLPKIEYDKAVNELNQAEGSAHIAEANVTRAQIEVERYTVRSPIKGIVMTRNINVGQSVDTGNATLPLFVIASDLAKMQIEANVTESDIGGVRQGMEAVFTVDAFPGETFTGKVTQVRTVPIVDQTVVTFPVIVETANHDLRLKPGMTASVSIVVDQRADVLTIPNKALRFRPTDGPDTASKKSKKSRDKDSADKGTEDDDGEKKASSTSSAERRAAEEIIVYRLVAPEPKTESTTDAKADSTTDSKDESTADEKDESTTDSKDESKTKLKAHSKSDSKSDLKMKIKPPSTLEKVVIKTGFTDGKVTEVLDGLKEGDRLAVGLKQKPDEKRGLFARLPEILSGRADQKKGR